jgi:hypothetical protein
MAAILLINRVARLQFLLLRMPQHCEAPSAAGWILLGVMLTPKNEQTGS